MRKFLLAVMFGMLLTSTSGCIIPGFSGEPVRRTQEMLNVSENLRLALDEWERFWMFDQPDHMTPFRTHGGLI
jgi:hypothetical protein